MNKMKPLAVVLVGVAIAICGTSAAFAKGHDQGAADGTRLDPSILNGGAVAGLDVPDVGPGSEVFLGVAADLELDLTYGQAIVVPSAMEGDIRVVPVFQR
jgi:hypothetical protein